MIVVYFMQIMNQKRYIKIKKTIFTTKRKIEKNYNILIFYSYW